MLTVTVTVSSAPACVRMVCAAINARSVSARPAAVAPSVGQQHQELFAAKPGHDVAGPPRVQGDRLRHRAQHFVARQVAMLVRRRLQGTDGRPARRM